MLHSLIFSCFLSLNPIFMKRLFFLLLLSSATILFSTSSCKKGGKCEEALNINQSEVVINFKNDTGRYLFSEINPLYNKDSLQIFDPNGTSLLILSSAKQIPNTFDTYLVLSFGPLYNVQMDSKSFDSEICKKYIIKYAYNETDTVTTCFKSRRTECGSVFETLKVFHKGILVGEKAGDTYAEITLIKK